MVVATEAELSPFVAGLRRVSTVGPRVTRYQGATHDIDVLISGVGMVATATWCSRVLSAERFDVALNLGVCGSFRPEIFPGSVVHVVSDRLVELGAEDGEAFLTIQEMKLLGDDEFPFTGGRLVNASPPVLGSLSSMRAVNGITVNTVHGNDDSIARVTKRFSPEVETMEGAAFMYACLIQGVPFAQVRAVSNMVERRNRAAWKLDEAIANLGVVARQMLEL
ncbi:MAG TPA: futalosine hydrolase [Vicinamibacterales bacterium]|nr:futalosine hydrolase [Vicinamibacterales bacterium]